MTWLWAIIIGGVAGWLAGLIMSGRGFGLIGNIVVGIIGAVIGNAAFGSLGMSLSFFWEALIGAVILLFIAGFFKRSEGAV